MEAWLYKQQDNGYARTDIKTVQVKKTDAPIDDDGDEVEDVGKDECENKEGTINIDEVKEIAGVFYTLDEKASSRWISTSC